jgi:hypothetical protein
VEAEAHQRKEEERLKAKQREKERLEAEQSEIQPVDRKFYERSGDVKNSGLQTLVNDESEKAQAAGDDPKRAGIRAELTDEGSLVTANPYVAFYRSYIGEKKTLVVTGLVLLLYLLGHLAGNLMIYSGQNAYNAYLNFLQSAGPLPITCSAASRT